MERKLVSIIMPTYNRKDTIIRAVESVINQTYQIWELIIVDDGGIDGTDCVIKEKFIKEKKVHYVKNELNKGPAAARNTGISLAKGEYIAFLDSDDEWLNMHLEEAVSLLEKTGYLVSSALWSEEKNGQILDIRQSEWYKESMQKIEKSLGIDMSKEVILFQKNFLEYVIKTGYYCFHINTIVINAIVIENVGKFDEKQKASEDMDFLYRVIEKYQLLLINKEHFVYHYGKDNLYAFIERDFIYIERSRLLPQIRDKVIYALYYKIYFFKKLKKRIRKDRKLYQKVKESIYYNLLRRYLTICLLSEKTQKRKSYLNALKYVYSLKSFRVVLGYKNERFISEYFCDD